MKYILSEKNLTYIVDYVSEAQTADDLVSVYKVPFQIDGKTYNYYTVTSKKTNEVIPLLISQAKNRYKNNKYREISVDKYGQPTKPEDSYLYQWIVDRMITETEDNVNSYDSRFFTNYFKQFFGEPESLTPEPIRREEANKMRNQLFFQDGESFKSKMSSIQKVNKDAFTQEFEKITGKKMENVVYFSQPYVNFSNKFIDFGKERVGGTTLGPNALNYWNKFSTYNNEDPTDNKFCIVSWKPFQKLMNDPQLVNEPSYEKINAELNEILLSPQFVKINRKILGLSDAQTYRLIPMTKKLPFMNYICKKRFERAAKGSETVVPQTALKTGKSITTPLYTKKSKKK